ncbi:MAG TPA: BTAD domain-containing putative transcriptional regulator [Streptosporangiaceae bacterium]|nr:BTAD domain-containing putative transcriptional regulator [Streptosporangiaceae bacterium]
MDVGRDVPVTSVWRGLAGRWSTGPGVVSGDAMLFGVLGSLLVHDGDATVEVPAARQRVLLAALALRAGRAVPVDELAELVWDGAPPQRAAATLRTYVMRLRQVLGPQASARLMTRYPGYLLDASEDEVDAARFTALCRDGGAAVRAAEWAQASGLLSDALGLWRGTPLADIPSQALRQDETPRLEQLRLQALEWRIDAVLALGGGSDVVSELQSLTAAHPLRERFHAQIMLALYRCGQPAQALVAYEHAREVLAAELGADPGTELRDLHQRVLTADAGLDMPQAGREAPRGGGQQVPRELPAPATHFTGREDELATLTRLLDQAGQRSPGTVVVSAIGGSAGVGKTTLAVEWAHRVAGRFPDGQLYVDLRGYDPGKPLPPGDVLARFLRALGVAGQDIPPETDERAARYRSLLAARRVLVLLDNAGDVEQVRPLLPGAPGSLVLVTSRDALPGLVARDGATRIDLDALPLAEAVGLLRALIGTRVDADHAAAAMLAIQCARLPLALRVAAELAASRPGADLCDLTAELTGHQHRLDLLDAGGDPRAAVRSVFSWSYHKLDPATARVFRLLGLYPGTDFARYAVAALAGTTVAQASHALDALTRAYLVQRSGPSRYGMHDLLRAYARGLTATQDSGTERHEAQTRLFDYYLHTACVAMDAVYPAEQHRRPRIPAPATPAEPVGDRAAAQAWLAAERPTLVAVTAHCAESAWPHHATRLAVTLWRDLDISGHTPELAAVTDHGCRAAQRTGDTAAEAEVCCAAGIGAGKQLRYELAVHYFRRSADLHRDAGNHAGQARALSNLGALSSDRLGRWEQSVSLDQQALALFRAAGDGLGEARSLGHLGGIELRRGHFDQAERYLRQAVTLLREKSEPYGEAYCLIQLASLCVAREDYQQADSYLRQAAALLQERANPKGQGFACVVRGRIELRRGRHPQAIACLQEGLAIHRQAGSRGDEVQALNGLGEAFLVSGETGRALGHFTTALSLGSSIGDKYETAHAHDGLGRAHDAAGEAHLARHHQEEALRLFADLGIGEAGQARMRCTPAARAGP